jgi:hypothetical protein
MSLTLDKVTSDSLFFMFKGEPGTRKSTAALSFPTPQYWISTDQKMEAMILPGKKWSIDFNQIEFDDFNDWNSIEKKLTQLSLGVPKSCKYKTIILDSITTTGDTINIQVSDHKTRDKKGQTIGGIRVDSIEDYKAEASAFRSCMKLLKLIHKHHQVNVIIIAHVVGTRAQDEVSTTQQSRVIITGGKTISGKIAAYCTEVYHFDIKPSLSAEKEGSYDVVTVHTGIDYARTSLPLNRRIPVNDQQLYKTFIEPAIQQLRGTNAYNPTN